MTVQLTEALADIRELRQDNERNEIKLAGLEKENIEDWRLDFQFSWYVLIHSSYNHRR